MRKAMKMIVRSCRIAINGFFTALGAGPVWDRYAVSLAARKRIRQEKKEQKNRKKG